MRKNEVWAVPVSLAATTGIALLSFPPGTEMVHFPGLARARLYIQRAVPRFFRGGFPHSDIPGSKPACGSPGLFAVGRVLRRLLAPRHPPYALSSLTTKLTPHLPGRGCAEKFARFAPPFARRSGSRRCSRRNRATSPTFCKMRPYEFACVRPCGRTAFCLSNPQLLGVG